MKKSTKKKAWLWTKRIALGTSIALVIRESYLALSPRRERRRAVYELAKARAKQLGRKLIVLGDPDGGLLNHMLGRQWQCQNDCSNANGAWCDNDLCIDPAGCGLCEGQIQGWPEDVLKTLPSGQFVIYDPGAFAQAHNASALAAEMKRVAGPEVFMADVEPWSLAAFFEPGRKRRVLDVPQTNAQRAIVWKPGLLHPEPSTGRTEQTVALGMLPHDVLVLPPPHFLVGLYNR